MAGLLCTWAQHTSQAAHNRKHCGLLRPSHHPQVPGGGEMEGPPEACASRRRHHTGSSGSPLGFLLNTVRADPPFGTLAGTALTLASWPRIGVAS